MAITVPLPELLVLPEVTDPGRWRNGKIPYLDEDRHLLVTVAMANRPSIHNTDIIREGEITSFLDYVGPKWKGKMVLSDPAVPGASLSFITLMAKEIFGVDGTLEILRQLAANEPVMTRDQRMMLEWVARGKYPVGIGQSSAMFTEFKKLGAPIAFTILKEPPFLASGAGNLFVFDKAPHPNAVKLFVNWLVSKEGASVWAPAQGFPSQRVDVPTDSFDPLVLPPAGASVPDEAYLRTQAAIRDRVGEIFSALRK
ncbi:MAG: ABC transporter substrate-binding protein [Candidatus Rokubacteria bacterium]|nr:ABC transporter substrate-binding protein [Candidatus Rokubacteria bacterium]